MNERILVLGASSGIAQALVDLWAKGGARLILAGRRLEDLERIAADARIRHGTRLVCEPFEAEDTESHPEFLNRASEHFTGFDGVIVCYGFMADQKEAQSNVEMARRTIAVNLTSVISILELAATHLERQGSGWIAGISSVAGDRGRQSNYIYGASKAGLSTYLQGLRNRLFSRGVHVLTVKPGFVYTALTETLLDPRSPLVARPPKVARDIDRAIRRRKNVVYTPWFWRVIMTIIWSIPEAIFKRLRL